MDIHCPVCKTSDLSPLNVGRDTLGECSQCHGLWFNREDLGEVEDLPESQLMKVFQDQLDASAPAKNETNTKDRQCPLCEKTMLSYQYDLSSGIWIQACQDGDGVWLDQGEVLKIHQHLLAEAKSFPEEKLQALNAQMKQMEIDENRKEENDVLSFFSEAHAGSSGAAVPVWHLLDGGRRLFYDFLMKTGVV